MKNQSWFLRFSKRLSVLTGRAGTFVIAVTVVIGWALTGPLFGYSDTWQLVINTSTTIITFLMVFLIQNTQNRDTEAIQLKLDEIIRALDGAHNALLNLEDLSEKELDMFKKRYVKLALHAKEELKKGLKDTGSPELDSSDEE
jgi:low affinity Fe/Cu permease